MAAAWKCEVRPVKGVVRYNFDIFKAEKLVGACGLEHKEGVRFDRSPSVIVNKRRLEHLYYLKVFADLHTVLVIEFDDTLARLDVSHDVWGDFPRTFPYTVLENQYQIPLDQFNRIDE